MQIQPSTNTAETWAGPLLAVGLFEQSEVPDPVAPLDLEMAGALQALLDEGDFRGKANETLLLYTQAPLPARRLLLVGLGQEEDYDLDRVRQAAGTVARRVRPLPVTRYGLLLPPGLDPEGMAQAAAEGTLTGLYRYLAYQTDEVEEHDPEQLELLCGNAEEEAVAAGLRAGQIVARAANRVRDLVNRPASDLPPTGLAAIAQTVAEEVGCAYQVLGPEEIAEVGMHALLAVARGSEEEPRFIILEHQAGRDDLPTVVLVGKGITFDSGGLDIKSAEGMLRMKGDMAGAATVLGILQAVAQLDLDLHVVGLLPATENMPGGAAYKPGDVLQSLAGKTIEVINTDAEGRLILADGLAYAGRYQPDALIDLATLTGSCVVALGHQAAGLMANDDDLTERIRRAADASGERVWPLPMWPAYRENLKSEIADLKNTGGRAGGAINAAQFLQAFVPEDVPWAHLDIAGMAAAEEGKPYRAKGPTGYGVGLLVEMLRQWRDG